MCYDIIQLFVETSKEYNNSYTFQHVLLAVILKPVKPELFVMHII